MKKHLIICLVTGLFAGTIIFGAVTFSGVQNGKTRQGPYLGENPPGLRPQVLGKDFVSTPAVSEFSCCFSQDAREFYFARQIGPQNFTIFYTQEMSQGWTEPAPAPFSGEYFNHEPHISSDGKKIFWGSVRPLPDGEEKYAVWVADRTTEGWGIPSPLGFEAMYITTTKNGVIYYTARGRGGACIARTEPDNGEFLHTLLAEPILSDYWDGHPCIAPDESFLIFDSENRPEQELCGLFISFRTDNNQWTQPQNMKSAISKGRFAMLSQDGKYLFFSAPGEGEGKDLYWVDIKIIEEFR